MPYAMLSLSEKEILEHAAIVNEEIASGHKAMWEVHPGQNYRKWIFPP